MHKSILTVGATSSISDLEILNALLNNANKAKEALVKSQKFDEASEQKRIEEAIRIQINELEGKR